MGGRGETEGFLAMGEPFKRHQQSGERPGRKERIQAGNYETLLFR
jgi:hypothetical protein